MVLPRLGSKKSNRSRRRPAPAGRHPKSIPTLGNERVEPDRGTGRPTRDRAGRDGRGIGGSRRTTDGTLDDHRGASWGLIAAITAATAGWLIYDMATTTEAPGPALTILRHVLVAGAGIGLVGSIVKLLSAR